ncbi:G-type lectin S-receptor-like serine/threonine-protein kinase B120 [Pistacia vera]|uniref:G-type lectin S-receptor-like serine/threonine-protein kinase B120 n=1 Tax=Pistacia vera TaxID=55513 RepID=UPI001263890B|nr:G-type lectin S-receptor-like serine/threonine-protein kinase B120 [Pistacia vera]
MAFTISPSKELNDTVVSLSRSLIRPITEASNHLFAVEFDTFKVLSYDIDGNHVGIDINSLISNESSTAAHIDESAAAPEILKWTGISLAIVVGSIVILVVGIFFFIRWRTFRLEAKFMFDLMSEAKELEIDGKKGANLKVYKLSSIMLATDDFSSETKLGEGGFGPVYKGLLPDGQEVAIKRLSGSSKQGLVEFKNELIIVAKLQHTNLVRLLGSAFKGKRKYWSTNTCQIKAWTHIFLMNLKASCLIGTNVLTSLKK